VGSRGVGISTGIGPFGAYQHLGGGRARSSSSQRAAYERQLRQQARLEELQAVSELMTAFVETHANAHREQFTAAERPIAAERRAPDIKALRREERKRALHGISIFKRSQRRAARASATDIAEQRAADHVRDAQLERAEEQRQLDAAWQALLDREPEAVLVTLEAAFADNDAPAAAIDCESDSVSLVVRMPGIDDIVPERQPDLTPTGRPTAKRLTKTERNHLYGGAVLAHSLVTVKEAFAVAPTIEHATLLALVDTARGLRPVYAGEFERGTLASCDWTQSAPSIAQRFPALLNMKGRTDEPGCLPLGGEPALLEVAETVAAALEVTLEPAARKQPT
jgi:hypothetical protein